ncbi:hypothetical protein HPB48_012895 [Haemaphysalis longicornis]|uniref:Uncharacterized protein n=1 Tax=Haemaphysalis longicornis TaxID=44386 RepID=A0A9J6GIY9_HAELO|nr:hypothetical protein HPB48_012895 [Haemaphysalis longicornis]
MCATRAVELRSPRRCVREPQHRRLQKLRNQIPLRRPPVYYKVCSVRRRTPNGQQDLQATRPGAVRRASTPTATQLQPGADNSSWGASRAIPAVTSPGETDRPRQLDNAGAPSGESASLLPVAGDAASTRAGRIPARAEPSPEDGSRPPAGPSLEEDPDNRTSRPPFHGRQESNRARRKIQNRQRHGLCQSMKRPQSRPVSS